MLNAGWAWGAGALAGVLACEEACLAYVGVELIDNLISAASTTLGGAARTSVWQVFLGDVIGWSVISVVAGPVLGVVGALGHWSGALGLLALLAIPVGAIVEMVWLPRWDPSDLVLQGVRVLALVAAALTGAAVIAKQNTAKRASRVGALRSSPFAGVRTATNLRSA